MTTPPTHPAHVKNDPPCSVPECDRVAAADGLCTTHHARRQRGLPLVADWETTRTSGHGYRGFSLRTWSRIQCHECGLWFQALGAHLWLKHGLTVEEYRARHDLPATGLASEQLRQLWAEQTRERMQGPDGDVARAVLRENHARSVEASRAKTKRGGTRRLVSQSAQRPRIRTVRHCSVCGAPLSRDETRQWQRGTCSEACWLRSKVIAAQRRAAERKGEEQDFTRRDPMPGDERVFQEQVENLTGVPWVRWQDGVKRGRFPAPAGREGWMPFWWTSDLPSRTA